MNRTSRASGLPIAASSCLFRQRHQNADDARGSQQRSMSSSVMRVWVLTDLWKPFRDRLIILLF